MLSKVNDAGRFMRAQIHFRSQWRTMVRHICLAIAVFLLILPVSMGSAWATGIFDVPVVNTGASTWVVDQGDVLSLLSKGAIEKKLSKLAEQTGNEVRFVTIRRFDYGETATTFANSLFERWFPTPELQANQALILLDTQTNTTDIRTGEKVKTLMSDEIAHSIVAETMLTPIRDDNYNQGMLDATNRLSAVLSGETDPGPPEVRVVEVESTFKSAKDTDGKSAAIIVTVLLLAATIIPMATYYWYQRG
jgi:uncharacterized protein